MTNRSTRRTIVIAAIVLVVVAAVGVGFYSLGRSTATPPPTTSASVTSAAPATSGDPRTPSYSPTDPNGSPEPGLPRGEATAGAGGAKTGPAGLPLGYTHDQTGAVNAATNYLMWMNSLKITDKKASDDMAAATAADPATRTALIESFGLLRSGMENMTADRPEPARGAYAVATYSATRVLVYVWAPEVTTDTSGQTDHVWAIDAVQLVWSADDWKLDKTLIARTGGAAVEPADPAGNPTAAEKHSILTRTPADPGEITDTADQSWFEYANAPH